VRSLPADIRRSFSEDLIPAVLEEVGCSRTPWENLDIDTIQVCVNKVYPTVEHVVKKGDALESSVSQPSLPIYEPALTLHNR
jgi:hypothetical protein